MGADVTDLNDFRRETALQCLLVFLESPGDRADKVRAAVAYADELIAQLAEPINHDRSRGR